MPDGYEFEFELDPLDAGDAAGDGDEDGLTNLQEAGLETNPGEKDSDGDGIEDKQEVDTTKTAPLVSMCA